MRIDLNDPSCPARLTADVCIVGAGPAGAFLANRLAVRGRRVVVLEAGGEMSVDSASVDFNPLIGATRYNGAFEGRAFGLGGTSARWGGVLVPHCDLDAAADDPFRATWQAVASATARNAATVREVLGLPGSCEYASVATHGVADLAEPFGRAGIRLMSAEMLSFRTRNFARLLSAENSQTNVALNAVARDWSIAESASARVETLGAVSSNGRQLEVAAREFVVAAGAIESARVLLELDTATQGVAMKGRSSLGVGLSDHLSSRIASVAREHVALAVRQFGPRFAGDLMKTVRMIAVDLLPRAPRHFAHFVFPIENEGFQLAKKVMFGMQAGQLPKVGLKEVARGVGGLVALGVDRYARGRLHVPLDTDVGIQLDVEQLRRDDNAIRLSTERDRYGRRRAEISWSVTTADQDNVATLAAGFLSKWKTLEPRVPHVLPISPRSTDAKLHDAYHPVGVCRMGNDDAAVLDHDLRVRGCGNLSVLSTAVLPTVGTANPTFTVLCLGEDLANVLHRRLAS